MKATGNESLMNYAGLFRRIAALALDFMVFCLVFFPVTYFVKGVWLMSSEDHLWMIFDPLCGIFLVVMSMYFILLEMRPGCTIGKRIMSLREKRKSTPR